MSTVSKLVLTRKEKERERYKNVQSLPSKKAKTGWRPKRLRKYHDKLETHLTSRSRVMTPDWSMDLKRIVKGNGSFTIMHHIKSVNISPQKERKKKRVKENNEAKERRYRTYV